MPRLERIVIDQVLHPSDMNDNVTYNRCSKATDLEKDYLVSVNFQLCILIRLRCM